MKGNRRPDIGRADLLRYFKVERNKERRAQAMALLGIQKIDAAPATGGSRPRLPERPDDDNKPLANAEETYRIRASLRAFLHATFWTEPAEELPDEDAAFDWAKNAEHVLATMRRPVKARPPSPQPLMPVAHTVRQLIDWAGDAGQVEVDFRALRHRVTRAQPLLPLPLHAPTQLPERWVVVVDRDSALRTYAADYAAITKSLTSVLGRQRLRVEYLEQGRTDEAWQQLARGPGQEQVVWVVLSDLGLGDDERRRQWRRRLKVRTQKGLRTLAVLPCLRSETASVSMQGVQCLALAGSGSRSIEPEQAQLDRLLMALSPFLTIDPYLIRAMRHFLCPGSSPLLEQRVWRHADLDPAVLDCKWKPESQAHALSRLRHHLQSAGTELAGHIWRHIQWQRPWVSASHHHIQCLLLSHQIDAKGSPSDLAGLPSERKAAADWLGMAAPFLLGVETANLPAAAQAIESSHLTCAAMATNLVLRMPVPMRVGLGVHAQMLDAASRLIALSKGEQTPVLEGIDDRLLRGILARGVPTISFNVALVQRGTALRLEAVNTRSTSLGGITLATGSIRAGLVTLSNGTAREQLMVRSQDLPIVLGHASAITADTPLRVTWPGGGLAIAMLSRPHGVLGWRQSPQGLEVMTPTLRKPFVIAPHDLLVPSIAPNASAVLMPNLQAVPFVTNVENSAEFFGVDRFGAFVDIHFGDASREDGLQRFRYIEPGSFTMGSTQAERNTLDSDKPLLDWANQHEAPPHRVTLTQGYWLSDTPCTQAVWQAVMGENPSYFKEGEESGRRPAENVSWDMAQGFLQAMQKKLPKGWEAALPTEAQWEYAARAGTQTAYWWGDEADDSKANWGEQNKGTTPVDRYEPNPWGLYDVHGNVCEWCEGDRRTYQDRAESDPQDAKHESLRALRGGSWLGRAGGARSAYRTPDHRGVGWRGDGLRLALRSVEPSPEGKHGVLPATGGSRPGSAGGRKKFFGTPDSPSNTTAPPKKPPKGKPQ